MTRAPVGSVVIWWSGPGIFGLRVVVMVFASISGDEWFSRQ
jgi:hypothetical protein